MKVDWETKPWWLRPLAYGGGGIALGLLITLGISFLSDEHGAWVLIALIAAGVAYAIWALWDLHRMKRDWERKVAEWQVITDTFDRADGQKIDPDAWGDAPKGRWGL